MLSLTRLYKKRFSAHELEQNEAPPPSSALWRIGTPCAGAETVAFSSLAKLEEGKEKKALFLFRKKYMTKLPLPPC